MKEEKIDALENDNENDNIIIKIRTKNNSLSFSDFEWRKYQSDIDRKRMSDAENSKGSAKKEA